MNRQEHMGWRGAEAAMLFEGVREARRTGKPLKAVFEDVARDTGRRPNSVRNYYYARIREDESLAPHTGNAAFVPFSEEEVDMLLREVLTRQGQGMSVRACTLEMGKGDTKAMLRYQNKYRSVLKNDPERVKRILRELEAEGVAAADPYARVRRRAGRPGKQEGLIEVLSGVVHDLNRVEGLDVTAFFENLGALAVSAGRGARAMEAMERGEGEPCAEELRTQVEGLNRELEAQRERFNKLLGLYRQLMALNREFLGMTGVSKMSSLAGYIESLTCSVEDCERSLPGLM